MNTLPDESTATPLGVMGPPYEAHCPEYAKELAPGTATRLSLLATVTGLVAL